MKIDEKNADATNISTRQTIFRQLEYVLTIITNQGVYQWHVYVWTQITTDFYYLYK